VLVVEDEEPLARLITEALGEDGHRVALARDGREALRTLDAAEFDLVISDVKMPGMGGTELYDELRRTRPGLAGRVVLTTGDTVGGDTEQFARTHRLALLRKPFDLDDLRRAVRAALLWGGDART
jgi:CheY-like chemotaxis protein